MNSSSFWFWNIICVTWLKLWIFQSWTVSFYLFCHEFGACGFILFCLVRQRTTWLKRQIIYLNGKRFWLNSQICYFNKQWILCKWSGSVFSVSKAYCEWFASCTKFAFDKELFCITPFSHDQQAVDVTVYSEQKHFCLALHFSWVHLINTFCSVIC